MTLLQTFLLRPIQRAVTTRATTRVTAAAVVSRQPRTRPQPRTRTRTQPRTRTLHVWSSRSSDSANQSPFAFPLWEPFSLRYFSSSTDDTTPPTPKTTTTAADIDDKNKNEAPQEPSSPRRQGRRAFVPRKAAVQLTDKARTFFKQLLDNPPRPDVIGIMLMYTQSSTGEPRMVFSFRFVSAADVNPTDEAVSLELVVQQQQQDGTVVTTPKPPAEAMHDGLPKLYVSADAFLKVLGATVDVDTDAVTPILYDKEGNVMDPNA